MAMPPDDIREGDLGIAVVCEDPAKDDEYLWLCKLAIDDKAKKDGLSISRYGQQVTVEDDGSRTLMMIGYLAEESQ